MSDCSLADTIAANLLAVRSRIGRAALAARRDPASVRLVAVSKTFGLEHVQAAAAAGQRDFGENRVQEALPKVEATARLGLHWHLIGHLQSNKARKSIGPFSLIQSVDSLDLLRRLEAAAAERDTQIDILVQVDLAGESTKHGLAPADLEPLLDEGASCRGVRLRGLMLLPPYFDDPERTRPFFRRLRVLRDELVGKGRAPDTLHELSMGMSHDFEVAIAEGATMVRVGTAIFGTRG